ncbi:uncharacterized protein KY384_008728 [Bacidia gigantensis]|uniref:uncharacterized protein n=1 Tax=Bacidia gigantensis TaxID=2732470 RepID=UPI001D041608|nr:uncharacterized protein KY384_008728 [Bacidia gigantensis]KAG8526528.1 hypothetical protein KY384_008728 [Bacidia gigantensis]
MAAREPVAMQQGIQQVPQFMMPPTAYTGPMSTNMVYFNPPVLQQQPSIGPQFAPEHLNKYRRLNSKPAFHPLREGFRQHTVDQGFRHNITHYPAQPPMLNSRHSEDVRYGGHQSLLPGNYRPLLGIPNADQQVMPDPPQTGMVPAFPSLDYHRQNIKLEHSDSMQHFPPIPAHEVPVHTPIGQTQTQAPGSNGLQELIKHRIQNLGNIDSCEEGVLETLETLRRAILKLKKLYAQAQINALPATADAGSILLDPQIWDIHEPVAIPTDSRREVAGGEARRNAAEEYSTARPPQGASLKRLRTPDPEPERAQVSSPARSPQVSKRSVTYSAPRTFTFVTTAPSNSGATEPQVWGRPNVRSIDDRTAKKDSKALLNRSTKRLEPQGGNFLSSNSSVVADGSFKETEGDTMTIQTDIEDEDPANLNVLKSPVQLAATYRRAEDILNNVDTARPMLPFNSISRRSQEQNWSENEAGARTYVGADGGQKEPDVNTNTQVDITSGTQENPIVVSPSECGSTTQLPQSPHAQRRSATRHPYSDFLLPRGEEPPKHFQKTLWAKEWMPGKAWQIW